MSRRTGRADLPLHGGRVPHWLAARMQRLGRVVAEAIVLEFGRDELLRRLADPFWFQAFGAVMGMDWHSSGITTSVVGALKRGLAPAAEELGLWVCGGRGRHSRRTPAELLAVAERTGLDGTELARTSRLVAKVDSAAVQDGYQLYLHAFFVTADGRWAVVQQGMNDRRRQARRYHWLSEGVRNFVEEPHAAIEGRFRGVIVNLTDRRADRSRHGQLELLARGPDLVLAALRRHGLPWRAATRGAAALQPQPAQASLPYLRMPARHELCPSDVELRRLRGTLAAAADAGPRDFTELLLRPGVGPRTVQALAFVAELLYGAPCRFRDPARFALAHGGKDGHPFPVPLQVLDRTIVTLRGALERARLGQRERLEALRRLDAQARRLEAVAEGPGLAEHLRRERAASPSYGGRTVAGPVGSAPQPGSPAPVSSMPPSASPPRRAIPPATAAPARARSARPARNPAARDR